MLQQREDDTSVSGRTILWKPLNLSGRASPLHGHSRETFKKTPRLYERLSAFAMVLEDEKLLEHFHPILHTVEESFEEGTRLDKFCATKHVPTEEVEWINNWGEAVQSLKNEFGALIPNIIWETIFALGTRKDRDVEKSILEVQGELPHPWYLCDAAMHALSKSFRLFLHVQGRLSERTGSVILHGCGCQHVTSDSGVAVIRYTLPDDLKEKVAVEFFDHFLSEIYLIVKAGLPFRMNGLEASPKILGL